MLYTSSSAQTHTERFHANTNEASAVRVTRLQNGAVVLTEQMPHLRSATVGIWIRRGSRHEPTELNGICHFIEHAVFKGTRRRTALDIATESDRLGGHFDAYTTHETTGFSLKVVDNAAAQAFDLLADMILAPRFDAEDLRREQKVIIEEIKMVEDTPDELLGELFAAAYYPNHPLGLPIEGTIKSVRSYKRERTVAFHRHAYAPRNVVIAAAGNVSHDQLVELAERAFVESENGDDSAHDVTNLENELSFKTPEAAAPIFIKRKKNLEQAQVLLAAPWPSSTSDDRYAATLLGSIIGGGTSSRLWQAVREERGLAYSVGAAAQNFSDCGFFQIYAGTSPEQTGEVLDLSLQEMRRAVRETASEDELRLVKDQAIASILLGLESTSARAGTLARQEIVHGRRIAPDEIIRRLEAVTPDDLRQVARKYFRSDRMAFAALGDFPKSFRVDRARLEIL